MEASIAGSRPAGVNKCSSMEMDSALSGIWPGKPYENPGPCALCMEVLLAFSPTFSVHLIPETTIIAQSNDFSISFKNSSAWRKIPSRNDK